MKFVYMDGHWKTYDTNLFCSTIRLFCTPGV